MGAAGMCTEPTEGPQAFISGHAELWLPGSCLSGWHVSQLPGGKCKAGPANPGSLGANRGCRSR